MNEGLEVIGKSAFHGCMALQSVTLPSTVTKLGRWAFSSCNNIDEVTLNEGLQTIGYGAFDCCSGLGSVTIPTTVIEIPDCAFFGCEKLVKVEFNEGLQIIGDNAFAECTALRSVSLPSTVTKLGECAFGWCSNLAEVQFNEGLQIIGVSAFGFCTVLRSITLPSTVTELGKDAFLCCYNLVKVQFNEGLQTIGECSFGDCTALRSVTIPSGVAEFGRRAFEGCRNLVEVILLGGERLLNQEFFARGFCGEQWGLLNQEALEKTLFHEPDDHQTFVFRDCQLTRVKISIAWSVSVRMARLPPECRVSVEERIHILPRLELMQDGNVLACFPLASRASDDESEDYSDSEDDSDTRFDIQDTNQQTARSVYWVLQLIAFHELKESSIVIELAVWKSRIDENRARPDCRVAIPGPAKILIMEYGGFADFLRPAIEGA